ncbi:MAG: acyl-CoA dehydrogenase family protein [Actinomycetota bacterium]
MDFDDAPSDASFRAELRTWLDANHPGTPPGGDEAFEWRRLWQRRLADGGWAAPGWPRAWGGRDASVSQLVVFEEELAAAGLPPIANAIGVWNVGPAIMEHGTAEQKQRWLAPMLRADEIWCQGFSEPGAGSDLAALATRATLDGDLYRVSGQKIWISYGTRADRCFLLCRTGSATDRRAGMLVLVVDLRAPGVIVRPLRDATGGAGFSEIFFDDVAVPADDRVGDDGWRVAMSTLTHERIGTITYGIQLRQKFERLLATRGLFPLDPFLEQQLAAVWVDVEVIRLTALRALTRAARGLEPWPEVPIGKLLWSTASQRLAEIAVRALGVDSDWTQDLVWSRMTTIGAGTTEIQKNVLAERALGFPR